MGLVVKCCGMLGVSVREVDVMSAKLETVTVIGKLDRMLHAAFLNSIKLIVNFFS
jgi:hypothetical protein